MDSRDLEAGIVTLARAHGVTIGRAVETVDTVDVPSDVAGVLRMDPDEAVLRVERIVRSTEGIPIEWCVGFVVLWKHEPSRNLGEGCR